MPISAIGSTERFLHSPRTPVPHFSYSLSACLWLTILCLLMLVMGNVLPSIASADDGSRHLKRARTYLAAGDYRRAVEACQRQIDEAPSAESYLYLTYVYQAIDGYLDHLSKTDRWVGVEQLYLNLATRQVEDLTDPPDVLARIAKEVMQGSVRQQSDVTAAMAARLDNAAVARLWKLQTAWRTAQPDNWWSGVPEGWNW
jgi:hypothetical protein